MNDESESFAELDPHLSALREEWQTLQRDIETQRLKLEGDAEARREKYDAGVTERTDKARKVESIETERINGMRLHRADLDAEATAAHDVAMRSFSGLGLPYVAGRSAAGDLLRAPDLAAGELAAAIGVPPVPLAADPVLRWLKLGGLAGSLLLGTFGLGSLVLGVEPRALVHSPLLPLAAGLGCLLVGGAYLALVPPARRCGTLAASAPDAPGTRSAHAALRRTVAFVGVAVAFVDAKAIVALDGARALVAPESVPPFAVTLAIASALSATYVLGASTLAYHEGLSDAAAALVAAAKKRREREWTESRRADPEVRLASEAANYAGMVDARRAGLGGEIGQGEEGLRRSMASALDGVGSPPAADGAALREMRERELRARHAGWRRTARERFGGSGRPPRSSEEGGAS